MTIRIISSDLTWMESAAIEQLEKTAALPGIMEAAGMPDLHPGKDAPIGAVFASKGIIYPHLVGNDIGCGMSLWQTDIRTDKLRVTKLMDCLRNLEGPWSGDTSEFLSGENVASTQFDKALGTIGGGNHFVEFQRIHNIVDNEFLENHRMDAKAIFLLVHSGSRGLGESILRKHSAKHGATGLNENCPDARAYLSEHDHAVAWAKANRKLIAHRFLAAIRAKESKQVLDICHNHVVSAAQSQTKCWLHRKGAAPADRGPVIIPGSRGHFSYLVEAVGNQDSNLSTLAHGAGRKWKRSDCRARLENRYSKSDLLKTALGSRVLCDDTSLLFEEAPQAYKNIDTVIGDMVNQGIIKVLAIFAPLVTYKTRQEFKA